MPNKDIEMISKDKCTGCYACVGKCNLNAITMVQDPEGFYFPYIDRKKCVLCGMCFNVCPQGDSVTEKKPQRILRGNACDKSVRARGSSGGLFELLARSILSENGVAYGAVYSSEKKEIVHTNTDETPLERILTSKYVQSQIEDNFEKVKNDLISGRNVLFCGTPCQVDGLNRYLGKKYDNLLTVDFVCHGVPSPGLFKEEINTLECKNNSQIIDVSFRSKINGWRRSTTTTTYANGKIEYTPNRESVFYMLFLNNYSLRKSCYKCEYYKAHKSDLTLADDWRIPKELDDDSGMSLIFINNDTGMAWLEKIKEKIKYSDLDTDTYDFDFYKHKYPTKQREKFFADYKNFGYEKTIEKWNEQAFVRPQKMSVKFKNQIFRIASRIIHR